MWTKSKNEVADQESCSWRSFMCFSKSISAVFFFSGKSKIFNKPLQIQKISLRLSSSSGIFPVQFRLKRNNTLLSSGLHSSSWLLWLSVYEYCNCTQEFFVLCFTSPIYFLYKIVIIDKILACWNLLLKDIVSNAPFSVFLLGRFLLCACLS